MFQHHTYIDKHITKQTTKSKRLKQNIEVYKTNNADVTNKHY